MASTDQNNLFSLSWLKPILVMIVAQIITAANNIFYKLAIIDSMPSSILVAYRFIFGTLSLAPLALYKSRRTSRTELTWTQVYHTFIYGLLGGSLYHNLCLASLTSASTTFVSGVINITLIITLVLGLSVTHNSRSLQTLAYRTGSGKIKLLGIILSIVGVMLLAFFKRIEINITVSPAKFSLLPQHYHRSRDHGNQVLGLALAIIAAFSNACFLTIQAKFKEDTQNIYLIPFMMNLMGAVQGVVYALGVERDWEQWKLGWNIRFWASSFVGVFGSGLTTTLITWCISETDPLFVSTFNPIGLILMASVGSLLLHEKLYVTSMAAMVLIISATSLILYGKLKEMDNTNANNQSEGSGSEENEV